MFNFIKNRFIKTPVPIETKKEKPRAIFSTNDLPQAHITQKLETSWNSLFANSVHPELQKTFDNAPKIPGVAMDNQIPIKSSFFPNVNINEAQLAWYANQSFIGYQVCALLAQNWLVAKCCLMPAEDAVRNGYEVTVNDGTEVDPEVLDEIKKLDAQYLINHNLIQFIQMGRIFGIRIAMFLVDSDDPDYYYKPFNPDGIQPGSYKGISQIDPYWITPQLDPEAAGNPASKWFYEPTWWNIAGKLVHRTHLVIYRTEEVADILKPAYIYGGISIPQKIAERVYAAERTANEAPMLALTKRTDVVKVDLTQAVAEPTSFSSRIAQWVFNRDNYGIKALGLDEEMQQFDTSLADLDAVIMTQYQLVAAAANVPAVKLMGTSPKGFNATGAHEESSYHEMLESLQAHAGTPLLERHHLLLIRSEIAPKFNMAPFNTSISWKPLDAMTAKEQAEVNRFKAETGQILMMSGAIDGEDERQRIISDPDSGYTGVIDEDKDVMGVLNDPSESEYVTE